MRRLRSIASMVAACGLLFGCASVTNLPVNVPLRGSVADGLRIGFEDKAYLDDVMVGLAFSGGGTRAAAFSFGVLQELERTRVASRTGAHPLLDRVAFVSGVSGGSVLTAYYGLKKRAALDDFRERFLLRNAEENLSTKLSGMNLVRALGGGVNDASKLSGWLNTNLYD